MYVYWWYTFEIRGRMGSWLNGAPRRKKNGKRYRASNIIYLTFIWIEIFFSRTKKWHLSSYSYVQVNFPILFIYFFLFRKLIESFHRFCCHHSPSHNKIHHSLISPWSPIYTSPFPRNKARCATSDEGNKSKTRGKKLPITSSARDS